MSYSRWSADSSVYVFHHVGGYITCCGCILQSERYARDPEFYSRSAAIEHLHRHVAAGHQVPEYAFARLQEEIEELSDMAGLGRQKCSERLRAKRKKVQLRRRKVFRRSQPLKSRLKKWNHFMKNMKFSRWKKITDYSGD